MMTWESREKLFVMSSSRLDVEEQSPDWKQVGQSTKLECRGRITRTFKKTFQSASNVKNEAVLISLCLSMHFKQLSLISTQLVW